MRLVRAGFIAAVVTLAAGGAHLLAGGQLPQTAALGVFVAVGCIAFPLTRTRLTSGQLVGFLVLAQGATHAAGDMMASTMSMLAAHVAATALSFVALRHGEDALRTLWAWLSLRTLRLRPVVLLDVLTAATSRKHVAPASRPAFDVTTPWRGPPAFGRSSPRSRTAS